MPPAALSRVEYDALVFMRDTSRRIQQSILRPEKLSWSDLPGVEGQLNGAPKLPFLMFRSLLARGAVVVSYIGSKYDDYSITSRGRELADHNPPPGEPPVGVGWTMVRPLYKAAGLWHYVRNGYAVCNAGIDISPAARLQNLIKYGEGGGAVCHLCLFEVRETTTIETETGS